MPDVGKRTAPSPGGDAGIEADVEAFLAGRPAAIQEIAQALRRTIRAEAPELVEYVADGYNMIMFGQTIKTRDFLFGLDPYANHVNLQLRDGAQLAETFAAVQGRGRQSRHVKVRSVTGASSDDIVAVIRAQTVLRAKTAATRPGLEDDVDLLLAEHTPELQAIERALRATIRAEFPDAVEQVDFGNKLIAFGRSMKMRGLLFAIIAHATWVNLQLADGAALPDPDGLIEGTGKRIRHVKIRSVDAASSGPVVAIVRAQLAARPAG